MCMYGIYFIGILFYNNNQHLFYIIKNYSKTVLFHSQHSNTSAVKLNDSNKPFVVKFYNLEYLPKFCLSDATY